ncbi:MAG: PAS domain-containing protein, partial [Candidatus Eisenbacteria bacterium]|nr:PAS domain-containing protein [Candidatus Eisenbacteria bacterium]
VVFVLRASITLFRYVVTRVMLAGGIGALLSFWFDAPARGLAPLLIGAAAASTRAAAVPLRRGSPSSRATILAILLALDLLLEAAAVATTGLSRSPFLLLFTLTIGCAGMSFGLAGGMVAAFGAAGATWAGIAHAGVDSGFPSVLTSFFLLLLGLLVGLLGRRMERQTREMARVQGELEHERLDAETIVESLANPLLCLDRTGRIRRANASAVSLLALHPDFEGKRLDEAGDPERLAPLLAAIEKTMLGLPLAGEEIGLATSFTPGAAPVPLELFASHVRDAQGDPRGLVLLLHDLTTHKEQEAEAARRERLALLGELSGHLAHEIRNSLKPVVGSIELLSREIPQEGVAGELFSIILRESAALETFLGDFLTFARDKSLTIEEIDLDSLLREEASALSFHPSRSPEVAIVVDGGGWTARADRSALRDVLRNLILNALEATPKGEVRVRVAEGEPAGDAADATDVADAADAADGALAILVEDTGEGLPEGDPEGLFEPFRSH